MYLFLSVFYGFNLVVLIYLISYIAVKGALGSGAIPFVVVTGKYLIYWKAIGFGFQYLATWGIISGLVGGIYLSLPILYWVNLKVNENLDAQVQSS